MKAFMTITTILFFVLPRVSQEDPESIVEEVRVTWWQVPAGERLENMHLAYKTDSISRLHLSLVSEFDEIHDGIRFPTKVHMLEKYKGGSHINKHRGSRGWERKRMVFNYTDYQFFDD